MPEHWTPGAGERAIQAWHRKRGTTDPANQPAPRLTLLERIAAFKIRRVARELGVDCG